TEHAFTLQIEAILGEFFQRVRKLLEGQTRVAVTRRIARGVLAGAHLLVEHDGEDVAHAARTTIFKQRRKAATLLIDGAIGERWRHHWRSSLRSGFCVPAWKHRIRQRSAGAEQKRTSQAQQRRQGST